MIDKIAVNSFLKAEGRGQRAEGNIILLLQTFLLQISMSYREQFIWKRGIQLSVKPLRGKAEVKRQRAEGDWFGIRFYSPLTPSVAQDGACIHKGKREEGNLNLLPSGGADTWG